jgi:hypothetical protein
MASLSGVETNEVSRFIDHTCATPWESFVADIEKGLKHLTSRQNSIHNECCGKRIDIEYQGLSYVLEMRKLPSQTNPLDDVSTVSRVLTMYGMTSFVLFSTSPSSSADCAPSAKMTVCSAFITAFQASNAVTPIALPAFFSYTAVDSDLSNLKSIFGYQSIRASRCAYPHDSSG